MNYERKTTELLSMKGMWGYNFKEIHDDVISEIKRTLQLKEKMNKVELQRMLYILEDKKELESSFTNVMMGGMTMVISVGALTISAIEGSDLTTLTCLIFVLLGLGFVLYIGLIKAPLNRFRNNKIKCMEIAIKELLQEGVTVEKTDQVEDSEMEATSCIERKDSARTYQIRVQEI
ncbi:MAG TPA: hypothetical protein GX707_16310 [Epulopiscium sp.]|nr:hypothetical protein [Candidatus Epulonipiscium sp.]